MATTEDEVIKDRRQKIREYLNEHLVTLDGLPCIHLESLMRIWGKGLSSDGPLLQHLYTIEIWLKKKHPDFNLPEVPTSPGAPICTTCGTRTQQVQEVRHRCLNCGEYVKIS